MMSRKFDPKLIRLPLCHPKMGFLLTSACILSQDLTPPPPTCVTSFMNASLLHIFNSRFILVFILI